MMFLLRVLNELMVLEWVCWTMFRRLFRLGLVGEFLELVGPLALR